MNKLNIFAAGIVAEVARLWQTFQFSGIHALGIAATTPAASIYPMLFENPRRAVGCRSGSILVMVLVVMLVVGLMVLQSSQSLVAFYQGDRQQRLLEQNRELIELGIAKARIAVALVKDYSGEEFSVPVWDSAQMDRENPVERMGRIQIEILNPREGAASRVRITARFPAGETGEMVSKWESK